MKSSRILIVGGGFGGVYALKALHRIFHKNKNVEISLLSEKNYFLFTPLLHEVATGGLNPANIIEPIKKIFGCCLGSFYTGYAEKVNLTEKTVSTGGTEIKYDYLVLAPGAETNFYGTAGAEENCFTLKSLEDAVKLKNHCIDIANEASFLGKEERKKKLCFAIIGGGPTGVELSAEMLEFFKGTFSRYYKKEIIDDVSVVLIQRGKEILPQFEKKLRERSLKILKKEGVQVLLEKSVERVEKGRIILSGSDELMTETPVWVAGVKPSDILFSENIDREPDGRVKVNQFLQIEKYPFAYILGDLAGIRQENGALFPMLAQVATKEAKIAAKNIRSQIEGADKLEKFDYKLAGSLVSLGKWNAAGEVFFFYLSGFIAWFVWRTIYLSKLISWQKKVKVALDWTVNFMSARDISRL